MFKNKKGLSDIVVTLLIVVLSLVAIGVVWVVIRNLLNTNTQGLDISSKCLATTIEATQLNCTNGGTNKMCTIVLKKTGGTDTVGGVKLLFKNETAGTNSPSLLDIPLSTIVASVPYKVTVDTAITNGNWGYNKVDITTYFKDSSGNAQLCSTSTSFSLTG
jgi:hypothetical protein